MDWEQRGFHMKMEKKRKDKEFPPFFLYSSRGPSSVRIRIFSLDEEKSMLNCSTSCKKQPFDIKRE